MRIIGGHTIEVYRPGNKDRHGDGDREFVGTIDHVVVRWTSPDLMDQAEETNFMSTTIFCPSDAAIRLEARDRFKLNGEWWAVVGNRSWDETHPMTGTNFGYYAMQAQVMS